MSTFIEDFYYGNIDPQARSTNQNKTVQKQMEWVGKMNNIKQRVTESINENIIYN